MMSSSQLPKMAACRMPDDAPFERVDGSCVVVSARYPFTVPAPFRPSQIKPFPATSRFCGLSRPANAGREQVAQTAHVCVVGSGFGFKLHNQCPIQRPAVGSDGDVIHAGIIQNAGRLVRRARAIQGSHVQSLTDGEIQAAANKVFHVDTRLHHDLLRYVGESGQAFRCHADFVERRACFGGCGNLSGPYCGSVGVVAGSRCLRSGHAVRFFTHRFDLQFRFRDRDKPSECRVYGVSACGCGFCQHIAFFHSGTVAPDQPLRQGQVSALPFQVHFAGFLYAFLGAFLPPIRKGCGCW